MSAFTKHENTLVNVLTAPVDVCPLNSGRWTTFKALWDTGAMSSVVTNQVARMLGLIPVSTAYSRGVNGVKQVPVYLVSIKLPGDVLFNLVVTEGDSGGGWDMLIGMDVISNGDFCVSNFQGRTTFSFRIPSESKTDYVQMINDKIKKDEKSFLSKFVNVFKSFFKRKK